MKRGVIKTKSQMKSDILTRGESIEEKMRRVTTTNEPIENVAPLIYTERKEGVLPECDIRTDRFEVAQEAMDKVSKSYAAKRENAIKQKEQQQQNQNEQQQQNQNEQE